MSVNKSFIPEPNTAEAETLISLYLRTTDEAIINELAKEYGYKNRHSFVNAMRRHYGVKRERQAPEEKIEKELERHPEVHLPPVKLLKPKFKKPGKGDEEIALLLAADGHADKITESYNKDVYRNRMYKMFESAMTIVNLHRNMYPIRKLVIANLGDNVQGENPHQGSKPGAISMGVRDQVKKLAAPIWNDVTGSFKQEFEEVGIECVPGNHGYDQLSAETSRADLFLYDILESGIGQEKGINVNVHEQWWGFFWIFGFRFFEFHGDGIQCQQGVPFFSLDKSLKSWHMQYRPGFHYALSAHFHKAYFNEVSSVLWHFMVSTLVSDDDWALKKLKISSNPSQMLLGVHPKYGVTWKYNLQVDYKFLPEPLERRE